MAKVSEKFTIQWLDLKREPQHPPNPQFPNGLHITLHAAPGIPKCKVELPYPAKRCGVYTVRCNWCGFKLGITTAGRTDDPRSVEIMCKPVLN